MDAVFIWERNYKTYFFKGGYYWRYNENSYNNNNNNNKHSRNSHELKFAKKSLTFSGLILCSKPIFCSKVAQKGKIFSRLLEPQKVAANAKSCSKVAEHDRERPYYLNT